MYIPRVERGITNGRGNEVHFFLLSSLCTLAHSHAQRVIPRTAKARAIFSIENANYTHIYFQRACQLHFFLMALIVIVNGRILFYIASAGADLNCEILYLKIYVK